MMVTGHWALVPYSRLILPGDDAGQLAHNKCDDCCPVVECTTCGKCPNHPVMDGGIAEWMES